MKYTNENKEHYKMYKKGRMWLIAGVTTLTWQAMSLTGQADTNSNQTETTTQNETGATTLQNKSVALTSTTSSETSTNNTDTANDQSATEVTTSKEAQSSATSSSATNSSVASSSATSSSATSSSATSSSATSSSVASSSTTQSNATDEVSSNQTPNTKTDATASTTTDAASTDTEADTTTSSAVTTVAKQQTNTSNATATTANSATTATTDDNDQKVVVATDTATTTTKTAAKRQLVKATPVATSYEDTSNLASGISGTSKWYVTSSGELHIEAGTLDDIQTMSRIPGEDTQPEWGPNTPWTEALMDTEQGSDVIKTIIFDGPVKTGKLAAGAFGQLNFLESIQNINLLDTSDTTDMTGLFYADTSLTSLDVSHLNTQNATSMFYMFGSCSKLTALDLSNFDTRQVTDMGEMFSFDGSLENLDVSSFNTSKVTDMSGMFADLLDMSGKDPSQTPSYSLDLSNFDTSKVTNMAGMFILSHNLTSVNLSSFDTSQVTAMSGMFYRSDFTSLDLSNFDMRQVTSFYSENWLNFLGQKPGVEPLRPLKTLKMGVNSRLIINGVDSKLPEVAATGIYTGKWVSANTGKTYTSAELMALYADTQQSYTADTFTWQKWVNVKDTSLIAGPKAKWTSADNFLTDSAKSFADVTVVVDGVVGGAVDTTKPGTYQVAYQYVIDGTTYTSETATVTVAASQADIITNDTPINQQPENTWKPSDSLAKLKDDKGNNIDLRDVTYVTSDEGTNDNTAGTVVMVTGSVDTSVPGDYEVTYSYTDAEGNVYTKTVTITVVASQKTLEVKDQTLTQNETWDAESGFVSGTDFDGNTIDFSKVVVSGDKVNTTKTGTYNVIYTYTDAEKNVIEKNITVTVVATEASVTVKDTSVTQGTTWDPSACFVSGTDAKGNAISFADVTVSGDTVNTSKPGTYNVIYTYEDAYGNSVSQTITVTVTAADSKATVNAKDTTVTQGTTWDPSAGFVSGTDADGNAISFADVTVSGDTVNTSKPGTYNVSYTYTDKYGNEVSQTITVTVTAAADSKATVNAKDTTVAQGDTWNAEAGFVSGTDADGNAINFDDVKVSGDTVDTSKAGTYNVKYTYTDKYGNEVSQTITVTVTAKDTGSGDNNGGTATDNNGNGNSNGGTDTGNNGNGDNNGGTATDNNSTGNTNTGNTTTGNTGNTNTTTNKTGSTVNAGYQSSTTKAKTVKLGAKTKGTAADQIAKGNLPQTDETTKSSAGLMGLALLGFTGILALAGVKRRRTDK